jgi:hypothetical protein
MCRAARGHRGHGSAAVAVVLQLMRPAWTGWRLAYDYRAAGLDKGGGSAPGTTRAIQHGADIGRLAKISKLGATTGKNGRPRDQASRATWGVWGDVKWPATTPLIQFRRIRSEQARSQHAEPTKRARLSKPMTYAMRMSNDTGDV